MAILKDTSKTGTLTGGAGRDFLFGLAGDDTLSGGGGDDVLLGGLSYDRAVYSGVYSGYSLSSGDSGAVMQIIGGQGRDLLFGIELIQFQDATVRILEASTDLEFINAEFRVNTTTAFSQGTPSVIGLLNGGFTIVWSSDQQDGSKSGIFSQRFLPNGSRVGSEVQVNTYTLNDQSSPGVTALTTGGYVVSWNDSGQSAAYAKLYTASGNPSGPAFQLSEAFGVDRPGIASLDSGGFVATWIKSGRVWARLFDGQGKALSGDFEVDSGSSHVRLWPEVSGLTDGGFIVTWTSDLQDGSLKGVYAQRFDSAGNMSGSEFRVNLRTEGDQQASSVAGMEDGGFVIVWTAQYQPGGNFYDICAQRYDAEGISQGTEFIVNSYNRATQTSASVAGLADGGFVIAWISEGVDGNGNEYGISAQRYDAPGNRVGGEFLVNSHVAGNQMEPSITAMTDGGFVISWQSEGQDGSGYGVYAQRYDAEGKPLRAFAGLDITGDSSSQSLAGLATGDRIDGREGDDTLSGLDGDDSLIGGLGNDLLRGDSGADVLLGGAGLDTLEGAAGADTLIGGPGSDVLKGGLGEDTFLFSAALNPGNADRIFGFNPAQDTLALDKKFFSQLGAAGALNPEMFRVMGLGVVLDANDFVLYNPETGALFYDVDAAGPQAAVRIATLIGKPGIDAGNIDIV